MRACMIICLLVVVIGCFTGCSRHNNSPPRAEVERVSKEWREKVEWLITGQIASEVLTELGYLQALQEGATNDLREMLETSIDSHRLFLSNSVAGAEGSCKELVQYALDAIKQYEDEYGPLVRRRPGWYEEMRKNVEKLMSEHKAGTGSGK